MATPTVQLQSVSVNAVQGSPWEVDVQTNDVTGTGIDISAGYTAAVNVANPLTLALSSEAIVITSSCTFSFGATGLLKVKMSGAALSALALPSNTSIPMQIAISNDAFATNTVLAQGGLALAQNIS